MNIEGSYVSGKGVELKLELCLNEREIKITMIENNTGVIEIEVPIDELKLAIRKLTAK